MKKFTSVLLILGSMAFVACGPSAEEIAKKKQDSIAKADSVAAIQAEIMAAKEKAKNDSIETKTKADEAAKKDKKADKKGHKKKK